jgi:hypothetical protein
MPDPRPVPPPTPPSQSGSYPAPGMPSGRGPRDPQPMPRPPADQQSDFGTLAIRVQPGGAQVLIDGEPWDGPEGSERLVVQLPDGDNRVEVRRDGFSTYSSTVRVRRGETTPLNVSLVRE